MMKYPVQQSMPAKLFLGTDYFAGSHKYNFCSTTEFSGV